MILAPMMMFCRPAPAARGSLPVSRPLLASINLTGRFPPASKRGIAIHPVSSDESSEGIRFSQVWATNCCFSIVFAFSAQMFQKRRQSPPVGIGRWHLELLLSDSISALDFPNSSRIELDIVSISRVVRLPW